MSTALFNRAVKLCCAATISMSMPAMAASESGKNPALHRNCRNNEYPTGGVQRLEVPDDLVSWEAPWPDYNPPVYNDPSLEGKPWADPDVKERAFMFQWNAMDDGVDRTSHEGRYRLEKNKPINPRGRTGLGGRGLLGRWGPNHAADPIVTRWKRDPKTGQVVHDENSKKPVLEFVAIRRKDCGSWAIPGGMIDPGELVSKTLMREFMEEAMASDDLPERKKEEVTKSLEKFFDKAKTLVYKGYVDDPRNTDNSWMETEAWNFHDDSGDAVGKFDFQAGSDASHVQWIGISKDVKLYASHTDFVRKVASSRRAHF